MHCPSWRLEKFQKIKSYFSSPFLKQQLHQFCSSNQVAAVEMQAATAPARVALPMSAGRDILKLLRVEAAADGSSQSSTSVFPLTAAMLRGLGGMTN